MHLHLHVVLLFLVGATWVDSAEKFKEVVRPHTEVCKEKLNATDDEVNALLDLNVELFSQKVKCLTACVMEELGAMKGGRWTGVPDEARMAVYQRLFEDDPLRLRVADVVINTCDKEADEKYPDNDDGCDVVWDAIVCMWEALNSVSAKSEL